MNDLAAALLRLPDAFPDDPGPADDPFTIKDRFDTFVWYGLGVYQDDFDLPVQMQVWAPRILRLLTSGEMTYTDQIPDRLRQAGWPEWPPAQRTAVEDVLRAWWTVTLTHYPTVTPVTDVLSVVTHLTDDPEPWLTAWSADGGVAAAYHLRDLLLGHLSWSFCIYDFDKEAADIAVARWLERDGVDILCGLPPGPAQDTALAALARRESWWWWE
jgi:hypothetical protein